MGRSDFRFRWPAEIIDSVLLAEFKFRVLCGALYLVVCLILGIATGEWWISIACVASALLGYAILRAVTARPIPRNPRRTSTRQPR